MENKIHDSVFLPFQPKVVDLFAGVGGLSLGAARAGFQVCLAVEIDKHALSGHKTNFPNTKHLSVDILHLTGEKLLAEINVGLGELEGLIGGPPCQGFSTIGKRSIADPRNDLFIKFFEICNQCQPKFFVAENVLGILDKKNETIREEALSFVKEDYYLLDPFILNASEYGAPTTRRRVFFIGYKKNFLQPFSINDFLQKKVDQPIFVNEALRGLPSDINYDQQNNKEGWQPVEIPPTSDFWNRVSGNIPHGLGDPIAIAKLQNDKKVSGFLGTRHSELVQKRYANLKPGEQDKISKSLRLKADGFCPTLRAGTGSERGSYQAVRPIHPTLARVITPREAARLQGFPDWFQFSPTKWHSFRQIGNSVSPILAEAIFSVIYSKLTK